MMAYPRAARSVPRDSCAGSCTRGPSWRGWRLAEHYGVTLDQLGQFEVGFDCGLWGNGPPEGNNSLPPQRLQWHLAGWRFGERVRLAFPAPGSSVTIIKE